jgi:hypothetical protein
MAPNPGITRETAGFEVTRCGLGRQLDAQDGFIKSLGARHVMDINLKPSDWIFQGVHGAHALQLTN